MMQSDPLPLFAKRLMEQERVTAAELEAIDKDILAQVDECVRFTEESGFPPAESLYEDVYVRSPYMNMKGAEKDPAWRSAVREDRLPEKFPAWVAAAAKVEG
jgi:TPP-dependent pyruvate/acetoin dehydrogenase alpha subunit